MAFTYAQVIRQVDNLLGQVKGADLTTAETNYAAAASTSNRKGPDYPLTAVQDAVLNALTDLVEEIARTKFHPERVDFQQDTASLANRAALPAAASGGTKLVGRHGQVRDASDGLVLLETSIDRVRSFTRHSAGVYSGVTAYYYAIDEGASAIEHTRTNVIIRWPAFERPASTSGNVPLRDHHEYPLVCGAVVRLAGKESMQMELVQACGQLWVSHLETIRLLGNPEPQQT